jgi:hypothetical protein
VSQRALKGRSNSSQTTTRIGVVGGRRNAAALERRGLALRAVCERCGIVLAVARGVERDRAGDALEVDGVPDASCQRIAVDHEIPVTVDHRRLPSRRISRLVALKYRSLKGIAADPNSVS